MIRTVLWFVFFWMSLFVYSPLMLRAKFFKSEIEQSAFADRMARLWSNQLLWIAGAKVEVTGLEQIPNNEPVVFVVNHQGNFDIPLMISKLPKNKGFIAKIETKNLPFVRTWMKYLRCIFIDREDIRQQVKAISKGIEQIKEGHSMIIFPEGTRSVTGALGEFKAGSLKLATKSGAPIVPVVLVNSRDIMPKGSLLIRPAKVKIVVLEPIAVTSDMNRDTLGLADQIKARMSEVLQLN